MVTHRYVLSVFGPTGGVFDEQLFTDKDKALQIAQAMLAAGSLSAEPGDVVIVEEIHSTVLFVETKPEGD